MIALVAAALGFGGVADVSLEAARIVFFIAIVLLILSLVGGSMRGFWRR